MSEQSKPKATEQVFPEFFILPLYAVPSSELLVPVPYTQPWGTFSLLLDPIKVRVHTSGVYSKERFVVYVMDVP